jgi:peroxin-16
VGGLCSSNGSSSSSWHLDCRDQLIGSKVISAGELVHLLRPLVYVVLLRRYGLSSWKPWVVSLGLELLSMYNIATGKRILEEGCSRRWPGGSTLYSLALLRSLGSSKWKASEQHELLMRRLQLVKYLIRSPAYDTVTRPQLERLLRGVGWVPLMGQLSGFAFNLIEGMQRYYSYVEP